VRAPEVAADVGTPAVGVSGLGKGHLTDVVVHPGLGVGIGLGADILTNVIVGGTGKYEGARGIMLGTAEGSGWSKVCNEEIGQTLPQALLKCLEGYIKIPTV